MDHDAHGHCSEEHHAEHWAASSGRSQAIPGEAYHHIKLWETISRIKIDFLRRIVYN